MSKISIAMATYCGERYVRQQLESLLAQERQPDEVLIFDDCSKDNTAKIVTDFIKNNNLTNWRFEVNKENKGFIKNFAHAIEMTTGDIIFLCDQDDVWHSDKLSKFEKLFDENPDAMAINGSFRFIDGDGNEIHVDDKPNTSNHSLIFRNIENGAFDEINQLEILKGNISPGCTMAIRKEVKDLYLEKTVYSMPHDFELNILATLCGKLHFFNEPVIDYRIHETNVIGLDTDGKNKVQFSSGKEKRIQILNGQKQEVEYFKKNILTDNEKINIYINSYSEFVKLREKCIINNSIISWFKMLKYYKIMQSNIPVRQIAGDLLYAMKLQRFFER